MKKSKIIATLVLFLFSAIAFAQPDPDAMPLDPDRLDAPISDYVWGLLLIAVVWSYKKLKQKIA